jgi:hypothetical protein
VEGYNSLDGNPALEFPAGSTRTKVTFQLDNEQDLTGPIGKVDSKTVTGDTETQYSHW